MKKLLTDLLRYLFSTLLVCSPPPKGLPDSIVPIRQHGLQAQVLAIGKSDLPGLQGISIYVTTAFCELAHYELLGQTGTNAFRHADREIAEYQSGTTIGFGIIKVRDRR